MPSQGVDPAPLAELNSECLGQLVMRAAESDAIGRAPPLLVALLRSGQRCRRRPCGGCPPRPSVCSMPGSRQRRAGSNCARAVCTTCRNASSPPYFEPGGALDHAAHARLRLAPRAQPAARGLPGFRRDHRRHRVAGRLFAGGARGRGGTERRSVAAALVEPDSVSGASCWSPRQRAPTAVCTNCCSAEFSALPQTHWQRMLLETSCARRSTTKRARESTSPKHLRAEPATQHNSGSKMIINKSAIAALAAVAVLVFRWAPARDSRRRCRRQKCGEIRDRCAARRQPRRAAKGGRAPRAAVRRHAQRDAQTTRAARQPRLRLHQCVRRRPRRACARSSKPKACMTPSRMPPPCPARRRSRRSGDMAADQWAQIPAADARDGAPASGHLAGRSFAARRSRAARKRRQRQGCARRRDVRQLRLRSRRVRAGAPFTRAAQDMANGDLPSDVFVLKDLATAPSDDCSDEGRAMMQLIHDVAPGSPLAFYTAFESQEDFAAGIRALAAAGSQGHRRRHHLLRRADVRRRHHRAGGGRRLSRWSRVFLLGRQRCARLVRVAIPAVGRRRAFPVRATISRRAARVDGLQTATASAGSVTLLSRCSGISLPCRPTAGAARRATSTCGSTT